MKLTEARKIAKKIREKYQTTQVTNYNAILALDNRITELEAQRDELLEAAIENFKLLFYVWDNNELSDRLDYTVEKALNKKQVLIEKITGKTMKPWDEIKQSPLAIE